MKLVVRKMNDELASQIASWRYDSPYDFYNNEVREEAIQEYLANNYSAVIDQDGNLFGFFCLGPAAQVPTGNNVGAYTEDRLDVGIGMVPELTGQGFGLKFVSFVMDSIERMKGNVPLRLTVATFNKRAIHLYEKCGFIEQMKFETDAATFVTMRRDSQ